MTRPLTFLLALVLPLTLLFAQPAANPGKPAPKAAPKTTVLPIVTLTKPDATTIRGRLVSADPDKVILKVDDVDQTFKWHEFTRLSNGLTRAKTLDAFKAEHKDTLCVECSGNHDTRCETCKGTGHTAEAVANCTACKGELLVACRTPKCKEGMIPCPNKCLKLSEGTWTKRADGKMWRNFPSAGGTMSVSDSHVGELMVREGDRYNLAGQCPTCMGKTTLPDPACEVTGKIPCPFHAKAKDNACSACEGSGRTPCKLCKGTGLKPSETPPTEAAPTDAAPADAAPMPAAPATPGAAAPNPQSPTPAAGGDTPEREAGIDPSAVKPAPEPATPPGANDPPPAP